MTSENVLREIAYDVLREMYDEAEPGLDFDDVLENPDDYGENWFQQHTLAEERQSEIVDKHCEEHDLNQSEYNSVHWTAVLDLGPSYPSDEDEAA